MSVLSTISAASIRGFQNPTVVNGPVLKQKLTSPVSMANAIFGGSIDITHDGSRIIVGQPGPGGQVGYAFIYVLSGSQYVLETTLSNGTINGAFGISVAISGDGNYCIIGAQGANRAYIYVRSGSTWTLQYSFGSGPPTGQSVDISLDGTYAVVGTPTYATGGRVNAGQIHILVRSGTTWSIQQVWSNNSVSNISFGWSVSINDSGDTIIIGYRDTLVGSAGQRPTFTYRTGSTWAPDPTSTGFGVGGSIIKGSMVVSVSNDGNYAVYGGTDSASYNIALYSLSKVFPIGAGFVGNVATNKPLLGSALTLNYDATQTLVNTDYYTGSGATWSLAQSFPITGQANGTSNTMTPDAAVKVFSIWNEVVPGNSTTGAVYIF